MIKGDDYIDPIEEIKQILKEEGFMLSVGEFAVVVSFDCCEGFEVGTCVEILRENYNENGLHYYVCRESQGSNLSLLQCPKCLHPIKATDACQEVYDEH